MFETPVLNQLLDDTLNKRVSAFMILALITVSSICILSMNQNDVRSNLVVLTPYSMIDESATGSLEIGDELYPHVIADSAFGFDLIQDGRSHCWITLSFSRSNFGPYNNLEFEFWSAEGLMVPEGSTMVSGSNDEAMYAYKDHLTGTEILFGLVKNTVKTISFKGTTMNEFDGTLKYVSFDIEASFNGRMNYVNRIFETPLPEPEILNIYGEENGKEMSGTLTIAPLSRIVWNGGHERTVASVTLSISDTSIPSRILSIIVDINDDYGFISNNLRMQYLDCEGNYVDQNIVYKLSGEGDTALILEGTITSAAIDSDCRIMEQTAFKFRYEAI